MQQQVVESRSPSEVMHWGVVVGVVWSGRCSQGGVVGVVWSGRGGGGSSVCDTNHLCLVLV